MKQIGSLKVYNELLIIDIREKVREIALKLDFSRTESNRIGSALSEVLRKLCKKNKIITVKLTIELIGLDCILKQTITSKEANDNLSFLERFFDYVIISSKEETIIELGSIIENENILKNDVIFEEIKRIFLTPSKEQLFIEIEQNNEILNKQQIQLEDAIKQANAATQAKSDFLANMSHEIRTPMNAIIGLNNLQMKTNLTQRQFDYAKKIGISASNLLGIINDILDFSKIEAGKLSMETITFDLETVISNICNVMGMKTHDKGIEFAIILDRDVPTRLLGDPLRLTQVLINLTNNAVKFTSKGEVVVHISIKEKQNETIVLQFEVKDTGIGMSKEQVDKLFKPFSQADVSTTRKYGGTGLGLVISQNIIKRMDGDIFIESEPNKGSTFTFTGRFHIADEQRRKKVIPESIGKLNILVADDNEAARIVLLEYLESFGFKVSLVSSGKEAISQIDDTFDLVILDWRMPGMDGLTAWNNIKTKTRNPQLKAIIVTAYDKSEIEEQCIIDGVSEILTKPITESTLFDGIMSTFGSDSDYICDVSDKIGLMKDMNKIRGAQILVVEDNEINQQVAKESLEEEGFLVDIANNGKIATEQYHKKNYDIILMDLQMPVLDGFEATKIIRKANKEIPIIALSADAMKGTYEKVIKSGMNDYVTKPIDFTELLQVLIRWIKPLTKPIISTQAKHDSSLMDNTFVINNANVFTCLPRFDVNNAMKRMINEQTYLRILIKYRKNYEHFTESLIENIRNQNHDQVTRDLHTLKGITATIGATDSNKILQNLEIKNNNKKLSINTNEIILLSQSITKDNKEIDNLLNISKKDYHNNVILSNEDLLKKLKELHSQLEEYDADCETTYNHISSNLKEKDLPIKNLDEAINTYNFDYAAEIVKKIISLIE